MSEPARTDTSLVDVRIGSTANALQPISSAERSLGAGSAQWLALLVVAAAAIAADQVTKQVVGRTLALGESVDIVGPFSIHHVQNSGIAFGLFASRTGLVIGVTAVAVGLMLWFFARSGRRHPVLPVRTRARPRREHREPDRPRAPRARDGLPRSRRLARVQPRGHIHRRRGRNSLRRARPRRPVAPNARRARWRHFASASLRRTSGRAWIRRSRLATRSPHVRWPSGSSRRAPSCRRRRQAEEPSPRSRIRGRSRASVGGGRARAASRHRSACSSRTSTSSSSTSPRDSPFIPGQEPHRHARGSAHDARRTGWLRSRAAGNRPPTRPRHLGLLVVSRSEEAHAALQEAIRRREVERRYLALVRGKPRSRTGRIDAPIGRDRARSDEALPGHGRAARRRDPLRGARNAARPRAPRRAPRDGADAPDPRSSRGDRPSGLGRSAVRRARRPRP